MENLKCGICQLQLDLQHFLNYSYLEHSLRSNYCYKLSVLKELPGPVDTHIDDLFVPPDCCLSPKGREKRDRKKISEWNSLDRIISCVSGDEKLLLLKGAPAVGKTLLMKKMAFDWAGGGRGAIADFALVFFIQLARVKEWKDANCLDTALAHCGKAFDPLLGEASGELKAKMCDSLAHKKILFLLDGLDEGALEMEDTEEKLRTKLTRGCEGAEDFSFIVTSRSYCCQVEKTKKIMKLDLLGLTKLKKRIEFIKKKIESRGTDRNNRQIEDFLLRRVLPRKSQYDELFTNPILLSFVFIVVEERITANDWQNSDQQLEELRSAVTTSKTSLYYQALKIFRDRYLQKTEKFEFERKERWFADENLTEVKRLAFHKLTTLTDKANQLRISEEEALDVNATALEIGYLMKEETQSATEFLFHHKTVMEFFAALYFVERAEVSVNLKRIKTLPIFYLDSGLESLSEVITFALELFGLLDIRKDSDGKKFLLNRLVSLGEHGAVNVGFPAFLEYICWDDWKDPDFGWFRRLEEIKWLCVGCRTISSGEAHRYSEKIGWIDREGATKSAELASGQMAGSETVEDIRVSEGLLYDPSSDRGWVGNSAVAIRRTLTNEVVLSTKFLPDFTQEQLEKVAELLKNEITSTSKESPSAIITLLAKSRNRDPERDLSFGSFIQLGSQCESIRSFGLCYLGKAGGPFFSADEIESIPDNIKEFRTNVPLSVFGSGFSIPPKKEVEEAIGRLSRLDALSFPLPLRKSLRRISKEEFIEWLVGTLKPDCRLMLDGKM